MIYKTAMVTGASSGIGKAIAEVLAKHKVRLILVARRQDKLEQLKSQLQVPSHNIACDITDKNKLKEKLGSLPAEFKNIDVLINCAGLALGLEAAQETEWQDWETMLNVNCLALSYITRLLLPGMVKRDRGHIVNIGSTAGTYPYPGSNVYGATKAFVEQLTINLKADLLGTALRVTNIAPAMVGESEFSLVRFKGDEEKAGKVYEGLKPLSPADVAESVLWVLMQPEHVNINRIEMMPANQAPSNLATWRETNEQ